MTPSPARVYLTVNDALPDLARHVLDGDELGSRKGERVLERLHQQVTLTEPWDRYPRLGIRKASLPAQIAETMWILSGRNDVAWLSNYLPRAAEFSDDGETWRGGYGPRLRNFGGKMFGDEVGPTIPVDQLDAVVRELQASPSSRRAVMGVWDPLMDARRENEEPWKDVPCNDFISFQSRLGKLHMHVFVRSNDLMWGWSGINAFEWSVLQEVVAGMLGIEVGDLTFAISSLHAYDRHWSKLRKIGEAYPQQVFPLGADFDAPRLTQDPLRPKTIAELDQEIAAWFAAEQQIRLAGSFDEAWTAANSAATSEMFTAFLQVIAAARFGRADDLTSRTLRESLKASPKLPFAVTEEVEELRTKQGPVLRKTVTLTPDREEPSPLAHARTVEELTAEIAALHNTKHAAYGDSWKRRGETLGILANVARKVDRLGKTDDTETALDTAVDLLVYLVKYKGWLLDVEDGRGRSDSTNWVNGEIAFHLDFANETGQETSARSLAKDLDAALLGGGWESFGLAMDKAVIVGEYADQAAAHVLEIWKDAK